MMLQRCSNTNKSGMAFKSGIALVDLLTAISALCILATVLSPVVARARVGSQGQTCQANLRYIAQAMRMYTEDHDKFPPAYITGKTSDSKTFTPAYGWADALYPYSKNVQILQCPAERWPGSLDSAYNFTDYFYNGNIGVTAVPLTGLSRSALRFPGRTILAGDGTSHEASYSRVSEEFSAGFDGDAPANARHRRGANYVFGDGHVKWLPPQRISGGLQQTQACSHTQTAPFTFCYR